MSNYQPKDNTGTLFKNDKKETDSHPNARGSAVIDGVEYWVDSWTNEIKQGDNAGQKYQKLTFKRKEQRQQAPQSQARQAPPKPLKDMDSDIPW